MLLPAIRPRFKMVFFDRRIISRTNWKKMNQGPLHKAGMLVRRIARGSIRRGRINRKGGRTPSKIGMAPKSWGRGKTPPFKMIFTLPSRLGTNQIVGMVGFTKGMSTPVPGRHEHGLPGSSRVFKNKASKGKRVRKIVRYPKRPFMTPALIRAKSLLPQLWRGSLKR